MQESEKLGHAVRIDQERTDEAGEFLQWGNAPLANVYIAIENGPVEIVDFLIKKGDFPVRYVSVYQRVSHIFEM